MHSIARTQKILTFVSWTVSGSTVIVNSYFLPPLPLELPWVLSPPYKLFRMRVVCAHMHSIARTQKILTFVSWTVSGSTVIVNSYFLPPLPLELPWVLSPPYKLFRMRVVCAHMHSVARTQKILTFDIRVLDGFWLNSHCQQLFPTTTPLGVTMGSESSLQTLSHESSLCTHAFRRSDSKDPDIRVLDGFWLNSHCQQLFPTTTPLGVTMGSESSLQTLSHESSLCTHAFRRSDSKDPDIRVLDGFWLNSHCQQLFPTTTPLGVTMGSESSLQTLSHESSLCTHAFRRSDSKDPDIRVLDGFWLNSHCQQLFPTTTPLGVTMGSESSLQTLSHESSLCTHAFRRSDSKDPDIRVLDGFWLNSHCQQLFPTTFPRSNGKNNTSRYRHFIFRKRHDRQAVEMTCLGKHSCHVLR